MKTFKQLRAAQKLVSRANTASSVVPLSPSIFSDNRAVDYSSPAYKKAAQDSYRAAISLVDDLELDLGFDNKSNQLKQALHSIELRLEHLDKILSRLDLFMTTKKRARVQIETSQSALLDTKRMVDINFICSLLDVNRSTIYAWIAADKFIKQTTLSGGTSRWRLDEVEAWIEVHRNARALKKCRSPKAVTETLAGEHQSE